MIKANELRIGNLVEANEYSKGKDNKLTKIQVVNWSHILDGDRKGGEIPYINPIPLTKEILEKCGFGINKPLGDHAANTWAIRHPMKLIYNINGHWVQMLHEFGAAHIYYLHQLQNLYFALTNKELEVQVSDTTRMSR